MKSKILKTFKENLWKLFLADAIFFVVFGALLLFARKKIKEYIIILSGYAEQVGQLAQNMGSIQNMPLDQVEYLTASIAPLTFKIKLLVYLVVPLGLYAAWSLTQAIYYNILNNKKILDRKLIGKHFLINLPLFAFLLLLVELLFKQFTVDTAINVNTWMVGFLFILLVAVLYFYQVLYSIMYKYKLRKLFQEAFKLAFYKIYVLLPLVLVQMLFFLLAFILLWNLLIKMVTVTDSGYFVNVVLLIVGVAFWSAYRVVFNSFVKKKC